MSYSSRLLDEFDEYVQFLYPDEPPPKGSEQWEALRETFFAGALLAYLSPHDYRAEIVALAKSKCECLRRGIPTEQCPFQGCPKGRVN